MEATRPASLLIGQRELPLPVYFPSISSVKTALRPEDYLQVLSSLVVLNGQFLVSAFDLAAIGNPDTVAQMLQSGSPPGRLAPFHIDSPNELRLRPTRKYPLNEYLPS